MTVNIESQVIVYVTLGVATVTQILRIVSRYIRRLTLGWDDFFSILAFLFSTCFSVITLIWTYDGGLGRPNAEMAPRTVDEINEQATFLLFMIEIAYAFALALAKLSILAFYWRLFSTSRIRIPIQAMAVASVIWLIIRTIMAIFHCVPVEAFWIKSIEGATCNIDDSQFFFGTTLTHLIIDVIILALPVIEIRNLQLRTSQKIGVIGLFMFGIWVCVASVIVIVASAKYDTSSPEMNVEILQIIIWANVEVNFAIVSACLPMVRPVFLYFLGGERFNSDSHSEPLVAMSHKGIKLGDTKHKRTMQDNDSTDRLADEENTLRPGSITIADLVGGAPMVRTEICGRAFPALPSPRLGDVRGGIVVRSDTRVTVEHA
ncbi:hypothetical protein B0I35DRAFT_84541 [Stachybotrys elegans]|uniref:Rhodopsin domain-containing protein n=1 Tax=Stachybotrys elegans TaxID=80388 RepID=A0A8K0SJA2_9HYPO|nr:hypothetical protein B0I35DRAFT_84541 [Stachybotrys elegans]